MTVLIRSDLNLELNLLKISISSKYFCVIISLFHFQIHLEAYINKCPSKFLISFNFFI